MRKDSRNDALSAAIDTALKGPPDALYRFLTRHSGLPGPRANMEIVRAFAEDCALRGAPVDRLVLSLTSLDADVAPGGTELEILPMCGVVATGHRAAADERVRARGLGTLHDSADDLRFRVRASVPLALAKVGSTTGDALVVEAASWMDGYFHAAAVLLALADVAWLPRIAQVGPVVQRLHDAWQLAERAERAAERYPGYKALVEALGSVPAVLAGKFGVPVFDALVAWSKTGRPELRAAIEHNLGGSRMLGRYAPEVERVRKTLAVSAPVRKDIDRVVAGTRRRGRRR